MLPNVSVRYAVTRCLNGLVGFVKSLCFLLVCLFLFGANCCKKLQRILFQVADLVF